MGPDEKHESSETSSDQETARSLSPESSRDGLGRLYECTFCKRGFTNAQALGGHMNIHRKDKAKAKQQKTFTTTITAASIKSKKDHLIGSSESFKFINLNEEARFLGSSFGSRTDDYGYQFTPSNPNFSWNLATSQYYHNHTLYEERSRVNLNIGIGTSSEMQNNSIRNTIVGQETEVDLELRLGHYPSV